MAIGDGHRSTLVTGGAGFIGSHLVERLIARGDRVTVVDNLSTGSMRNLDGIADSALSIVKSDVASALKDFDQGQFDQIYHLAAAVGVQLIVDQPIQSIENNVLETSAVLRYAANSRTPTLLASSSEVYGKSTQTPFAEGDNVTYGPTIYPRWSYACSKAIDEYLALGYAQEYDLPVVVARFFNTVGPRQIGDYGMVVPRFVADALAECPLRVFGDGHQTRCFCDVRNVVSWLPRLIEAPGAAGEVFNVGNDEPIEILQLAELVCSTLKSTSTIELVSYETAYGRPFDDLRVRQPDLTKLRSVIELEETIPLTQTICDIARELKMLETPVP
jgi:UDP-glucose 4-epimerase